MNYFIVSVNRVCRGHCPHLFIVSDEYPQNPCVHRNLNCGNVCAGFFLSFVLWYAYNNMSLPSFDVEREIVLCSYVTSSGSGRTCRHHDEHLLWSSLSLFTVAVVQEFVSKSKTTTLSRALEEAVEEFESCVALL